MWYCSWEGDGVPGSARAGGSYSVVMRRVPQKDRLVLGLPLVEAHRALHIGDMLPFRVRACP
jgi:hypothetical protein